MKKKKFWERTKAILKIASDNDLSVYAGNATLYIVIASFPFMLLLVSLVNLIPNPDFAAFCHLLTRFLPDISQIKEFVTGIFMGLRTQSYGFLAGAAALTFLWFASSGVRAIQKGLRRITPNVETGVRSMLVPIIFTLSFLILLPCLFVFQLFGSSIKRVLVYLAGEYDFMKTALHIVGMMKFSTLVTALGTCIVLVLMFTYLPGGHRSIKEQLPGGIFTAACWLVFTKLFSIFIPIFFAGNGIYGSLTALFLILLWLRILMYIMFVGASLNTVLKTERESERHI